MSKTKVERIASVEDRIKQLENQRRQLIQKHKADERKARTRRLIQRGAILEGFIPDPADYTEEQIQAFLKEILDTDYARKVLRRMKPSQKDETSSAKPPVTQQDSDTPSPAKRANAQ